MIEKEIVTENHLKNYEYIEFVIPGSLFSETERVKITDKEISIPDMAFSYYFYDLVDGVKENTTGQYYIVADLYSLDDIRKLNVNGDFYILQTNMENNGFDFVVKTKFGTFCPFKKEDQILSSIKNFHRTIKYKKILDVN